MKIQSDSADPGIVTAPRSVVQVPMSDNVPTGSGEISASHSVLPARLHVSRDEEDKEEDEESGHDDDEEDVDNINHVALTKDLVRANILRVQTIQSNPAHHQQRMGSVSFESAGNTISGLLRGGNRDMLQPSEKPQ